MPDDWEWFWAGQHGRDSLLRSELEGVQSEASAARSQAARLSSHLAQVQGSLETRLSALAAAFDAYVELGDVREQLAGYPTPRRCGGPSRSRSPSSPVAGDRSG